MPQNSNVTTMCLDTSLFSDQHTHRHTHGCKCICYLNNMAQDVKMITAFGLKRAKNTCVESSAALRRVYDRAQYFCLHSVVTLQILFMLKQQHYTLTNAGPMMVYCIFILLKNVSSTCSSTTSSTFWSTTRSRVPHSGRPYSTSLVLSIPLSGSVVSVYYLLFSVHFRLTRYLFTKKWSA